MHEFLRHLEAMGFQGAPRVVGIDAEGDEIVTFIEGEALARPSWQFGQPTPWPEWARTDEVLAGVGELLGDLHRASASFVPEAPVWRRHQWPGLLPGQVVCHGDVGPHNTVYREGKPIALIDWDEIGPNEPHIEFGIAAWHYVPLGTDDFFAASDWPERPDLAHRLALFAESYGTTDRETVFHAVQQAKQRSAEALRHFPVSPGEAAGYLRVVATDLEWLSVERHRLGARLRA
ncbi:MAG TPA: aminoglycoside phosphotransferase family protein [Acidimicrobiales bacterium]|nr:aminoglycoside phosphotransferase family protein [Acidimicrobiales bacterium]